MRRLMGLLVALGLVLAVPAGASAMSSTAFPPPGSNDFKCKPSAAHPEPLVLVHGLSANQYVNWVYLAPQLKARGYCVFSLTYGLDPRFPVPGGVLPIEQSAKELGPFVDKVLAATGASKVDLIGHSEGTFMPQYWLKFLGGASKVDQYIAMTPLYNGTNVAGAAMFRDLAAQYGLSGPIIDFVNSFCGSCTEFLTGSPMVQKLTAGGAAVPGVRYTTIMTKYDELVAPYTSGRLPAPATNYVLQDVCPNDISEHGAEAFDPVVAQIVFNALDPAHAKTVSCVGLPPIAPPPSL